ncbi:MAG TPA: methylated-DNA--[protein]-cysteine S-methyltransferase [Pseudohaliea sp.]|nr:methylated-DNA--[protein]-cysteine S-methyltransferase [Pseudohaliea sp.]
MLSATIVTTPLGSLQLIARDGLLERIAFPGTHVERLPSAAVPVLSRAAAQLRDYFAGRRRAFDLPLASAGTAFQEAVWAALGAIPFGETRSYGDIARALDRPRAVRAVGAANGRNPLPIVVPCHRVIGADGSLTGYAGGMARKRWLLELEGWRG